MNKQKTTEFDSSIELLLSLGTIDGERRALIKSGIKAHVSKLAEQCIGGYERTSGKTVPINKILEKVTRNNFRKEIHKRLKERGIEIK